MKKKGKEEKEEEVESRRGRRDTMPSISVSRSSSSRLHPIPCSQIESLSEEILLEILSYLSIHELLTVSRVSRRFNRLSDEPHLWRRIYYSLFTIERLKHPFLPAPNQRLRGSIESRSTQLQTDRKGKKRQSCEDDQQPELGHTWKTLCRISLNWKTGSAGLTLITPINPSKNPVPSTALSSRSQDSYHPRTNTIVRFHRSLLFIARKCRSTTESPPTVSVYRLENHSNPDQPNGSVLVAKLSPSTDSQDQPSISPQGVTEISIDDACHEAESTECLHSTILLSVFYTSGRFVIFKIRLPSTTSGSMDSAPLDFQQVGSYEPTPPQTPYAQRRIHHELVQAAKFHFPLIVTCSTDFHLRFFCLSWSSSMLESCDQLKIVKLSLDMQNHSCYWPLSLSLRRSEPSSERFKMSIAYPMPFYPSTWTIGLQEFEFEITRSRSCSSSLKMLTNRFLTAFHNHQDKNRRVMTGHGLGEIVIGIEQAAENVIVGRSDNTIDFFRLAPAPDGPTDRRLKRLSCSKTLFGHTSRIGSISIDETGRCVSGAMDGVKVWEGSEPVDVRSKQSSITTGETRSVGWIGLDSEKIVSLWIREDHERAGKTATLNEEIRVMSFI